MAALTATFWTESVEDRWIEGKKRYSRVRLTLSSTQAGTYPSSGGIPLPTTLGMKRNVDYVVILQGPTPAAGSLGLADGINWTYSVSEKSIHGHWGDYPVVPTAFGAAAVGGPTHLAELPTTWKPSLLGTAPVMYVQAVGW